MTTSITRAVPAAEIAHLLDEIDKGLLAMTNAQVETYSGETQAARSRFAHEYSHAARQVTDDVATLRRRLAELGGRP